MDLATARCPVMLYDGDCGFCQHWVDNWRRVTGEQVRYEPYQKAVARYPQVTEEMCRRAVQLVMPDGAVFSGAHAVFKTFAVAGARRWPLRAYERLPLFGALCEMCYQIIARSRASLSRLYGEPKCRI